MLTNENKYEAIQTISQLKNCFENTHVIGVIGHRDLLNEDCRYLDDGSIDRSSKLSKAVKDKLSNILDDKNNCVLLSPLAKGADLLVAQAALDLEIQVVGIPPKQLSDLKEYFSSEDTESTQKWLDYLEYNFSNCESLSKQLNIDTLKKSDEDLYDLGSRFLLINCDSLIFLWDGVFTGSKGGTSVSYHQALNGFTYDDNLQKRHRFNKKNKHINTHHLSVPRTSNPFPAGKRYQNEKNKEVNLADYTKVYPYLWHEQKVLHPIKKYRNKNKKNLFSNFIRNRFFWLYGVPVFLVLLMFFLGFWSTWICHNGFSKGIWGFLELVTLPNSDFNGVHDFADSMLTLKSLTLITSVFIIPYTIIIAIFYAISNDRRILATRFPFSKKVLILGLGWKGTELAMNLNEKSRFRKIVVIEKDPENANIKTCLRAGIRVIHGNFNDENILKKINWKQFNDIYVLAKDDETNIRTVQLIDTMSNSLNIKYETYPLNIYVHLDDFRNKFFINKALQNNKKLKLNSFNVYENSIRRILLNHPLDRFYFNEIRKNEKIGFPDSVKVVILGFNEAAQALFRYCFTHCIYPINIKVCIDVYLDKEEDINTIRKDIPYVFEEKRNAFQGGAFPETTFRVNGDVSSIGHYTYKNFIVKINHLPQSEYSVLNEPDYLTSLKTSEIASIFTCIDDGLKSSAYLSAILPLLEVKKAELKADLQAFCYFNFPEEKENTFIEESINNIAKHIPVFFFGNFTEELTELTIKEQQLDLLAKLINAFYETAPDNEQIGKSRGTEELNVIKDKIILKIPSWNLIDELKRESNRLAADHMYLKLRCALDQDKLDVADYYAKIKETLDDFQNHTGERYELSEMEHRRWCAERLFYGWKPATKEHLNKKNWDDNKIKYYEPQKLHKDLIPFTELELGELKKDIIIAENIDLMFELLREKLI
ncbi:MAG: NAD-binding protein [Draconibacterium sp.]